MKHGNIRPHITAVLEQASTVNALLHGFSVRSAETLPSLLGK